MVQTFYSQVCVKEYKFDSVQVFYKELNAAKSEYLDCKTIRVDWEKTYGNKAVDTTSIRDRLKQKEQVVKEREAGRGYRAKQKNFCRTFKIFAVQYKYWFWFVD